MMNSNTRDTCLFLPWNTPSSTIDPSATHLYHPMSFPLMIGVKSRTGHAMTQKMPNGFVGAGSIACGAVMGIDVVVTISKSDNIAARSLEECINNFVYIDDPFAEAQILKTYQLDIAGQLEEAFNSSDYKRAIILWPYQDVSFMNIGKAALFKEAEFFYSHKMITGHKEYIAESVAIAATADQDDAVQCASALPVGTIPDIILGSYTRLVNLASIDRSKFTAFRDSGADDTSIGAFLKETLPGSIGHLSNPDILKWMY